MFSLFLLACTELKPVVPQVGSDDPDTLSPAPDPGEFPTVDELLARHGEVLCETLEVCLDADSGNEGLELVAYAAAWEEYCAPGAADPEPPCEDPDPVALRACVEGEWTCDAGIQTPAACGDVCPADTPDPIPTDSCGTVVDWSGGPLFYRAPLRFQFDRVDPSAAVSLQADGVYYGGDLEWEGDELVFTPPPLPPGAAVSLDVISCSGGEVFSAATTVTDFGGPLQAPANGAYRVDLSEGTFVAPPGLGMLVAEEIDRPLFVGIVELGDSLQVGLHEGAPSGQAVDCDGESTTGFTDFDESPWFEVELPMARLPRSTSGEGVWVYDLTVSGAFDPSATSIGGLTLRGLADASEITQGGSCSALLGPLGIDCVPCPDGALQCVELEISGLVAEYQWWIEDLQTEFVDGSCE